MTKKEFNKRVIAKKKELLQGNAMDMLNKLNTQNMYRYGSIDFMTFDEVLTEIAQANILDVDFVDRLEVDEEIKELK